MDMSDLMYTMNQKIITIGIQSIRDTKYVL